MITRLLSSRCDVTWPVKEICCGGLKEITKAAYVNTHKARFSDLDFGFEFLSSIYLSGGLMNALNYQLWAYNYF